MRRYQFEGVIFETKLTSLLDQLVEVKIESCGYWLEQNPTALFLTLILTETVDMALVRADE